MTRYACEKWLKDRTLTKDDLAHYPKIVVALSETIRLMSEIDAVIAQHGGWPLKRHTMKETIQVVVDKASFLEVGRIFKRFYRPAGACNVILTLGNDRLRIEFYGGGCELRCDHNQQDDSYGNANDYPHLEVLPRWRL